eukprot:TRINITY_DN1010_c0_g1_i1.p1 TRINITY_DN1010_c0_g1~~TRINITY_DN1010_c0_g1_i1.p1  ORF type:complete len:420 (-),score=46.47 TRINITY_DN1010_c0_g1_i1:1323-2582(-)
MLSFRKTLFCTIVMFFSVVFPASSRSFLHPSDFKLPRSLVRPAQHAKMLPSPSVSPSPSKAKHRGIRGHISLPGTQVQVLSMPTSSLGLPSPSKQPGPLDAPSPSASRNPDLTQSFFAPGPNSPCSDLCVSLEAAQAMCLLNTIQCVVQECTTSLSGTFGGVFSFRQVRATQFRCGVKPSESPSAPPSVSPSVSPSLLPSPSQSISVSPTPSPTSSPSMSPSASPSPSASKIPTSTAATPAPPAPPLAASPTPSSSTTPAPSISAASTPSPSISMTPSPSISMTPSPSTSVTPSSSISASPSSSTSVSPSPEECEIDLDTENESEISIKCECGPRLGESESVEAIIEGDQTCVNNCLKEDEALLRECEVEAPQEENAATRFSDFIALLNDGVSGPIERCCRDVCNREFSAVGTRYECDD